MSVLLEKNGEDPYQLVINDHPLFLATKLDGIIRIMHAFFRGKIRAQEILPIIKELKTLAIPYSPDSIQTKEDQEFRGIIDFFEKKIEAEKTGAPNLFLCAGCGLHSFLLGKNFLVTTELYSKEDTLLALNLVYKEEKLISEADYLRLENLLQEMKLREFPGLQQEIQRFFGAPFELQLMVTNN